MHTPFVVKQHTYQSERKRDNMSVSNCSSGNNRERDVIIPGSGKDVVNGKQMSSGNRSSGFGGPREIRGTDGDDVIIGGKNATINGKPVNSGASTRGGQSGSVQMVINGRVVNVPKELASRIFSSDSFRRQQNPSRPQQHFSTNRSRPFQGSIAYTAPPAPIKTSSERSSDCPPRTSSKGCKGGVCPSDLNVGETLDANGNRVPPKSNDEGDVIIA